jgi:hypothetical protein
MTNHHVAGRAADVRCFMFNYHDEAQPGTRVDTKPTFFYSSEELDFAVIGVDEKKLTDLKVVALDLGKAATTFEKGDALSCFQHPEGKPCHLTQGKIYKPAGNFLYHTCSTEYGSSGGLIYNSNMVAVALHHERVTGRELNRAVLFSSICPALVELIAGRVPKIQGKHALDPRQVPDSDSEDDHDVPQSKPQPAAVPKARGQPTW